MKPGQHQLRDHRSGQGQEHIPLGIPDITLSRQKCVGLLARKQGGPRRSVGWTDGGDGQGDRCGDQ